MQSPEEQVYRTRLEDALRTPPSTPPIEAIDARARRETNLRNLMGFGFSHLVMTLLVFISCTYRVLPKGKQRTSSDVESAPAND